MADDELPPEPVPLSTNTDSNAAAAKPRQPVPVTLITGFLGSGKTTLVRHILSAPHGLRIAVILNEFGEGVEEAYYQDIMGLRDKTGEWIELDNGCMCCSVKSEFVQALESLLAKEQRPDYILIETTGMANPGPVAAALWTDDEVEAGVQLDSIVTVVDAINIDRQLHDARGDGSVNEAQVQVAYADLILLNKMDLCGDEAVDRAEADIRAINSTVHIIRTTQSVVDLQVLLSRHGYKHGAEVQLPPIQEDDGDGDAPSGGLNQGGSDPASSTAAQASEGGAETAPLDTTSVNALTRSLGALGGGGGGGSRTPGGGGHSSSHSRGVSMSMASMGSSSHSQDLDDPSLLQHAHTPGAGHTHDPRIQTVCVSCSQPLSLERVKSFLDKLLWDRETHPEDIYRVKGVLHIRGDDRKHMVQAVYELYNISASAAWQEGEARVSRVVVIGRQLKKDVLQRWFDEAASGAELTTPAAANADGGVPSAELREQLQVLQHPTADAAANA